MTSEAGSVYRQIVHPLAQATLKTECSKLTDLTKIIHDFLATLAGIYETAGSSLLKLVEENKKRVSDVTRENLQYPNTTLTAWHGLLENFRAEGNLHVQFGGDLRNETVSTLHEQRVHVKESVKRIYGFRDLISSTVVREADSRDKCQKDYTSLWNKYRGQLNAGTTKRGSIMPTYTAYNNYLLQLTLSNGMTQSALDVQLPNLMQEVEAVEHNLHNLMLSVLNYTFSRQAHHFVECGEVVSNSVSTTHNINPAQDVARLGESLVLPPEIHPVYQEKEFIPADTEEAGIPKDISNGYLAREEYTSHTLGKKYRVTKNSLVELEAEANKHNKDLDALSKLLATYQETPTYGKATDIEVQMSSLRHELRLLEMSRCGLTSQLGLLEESGISNSGSVPSDEDTKSVQSYVEPGEHEWTQLSMTEMRACDLCQRPTMLQKSFQCNKCKVNCHGSCRSKVFDCVGQPLEEQSADKVSKFPSLLKGAGGLFGGSKNTSKRADAAQSNPDIADRDKTLRGEWWTLKHGPAPDLSHFSDGEVYDDVDRYKDGHVSEEDEEEEELKAPMVIKQSEIASGRAPLEIASGRAPLEIASGRAPLAPPEPQQPSVTSSPAPVTSPPASTEGALLRTRPPASGALFVCVALYEYRDLEESSEAWCAPGFRVDVLEETNQDWYKGLCDGKVGYFPASYLERVPETGAVLRGLYDYQATRPDEISLTAGQVVFLVEDQNNGWMYGRFRTSRGLFPKSYVEELGEFK